MTTASCADGEPVQLADRVAQDGTETALAVGNGEGDGLGLGDGDEGEVEADPEGGNAEGVVRTATLVVVPHAASTITAASASRPVLRLIGKTTRAAGRGLRGVVLGAQAHKDKQKRGPNHP